jgi:hypothetical protein
MISSIPSLTLGTHQRKVFLQKKLRNASGGRSGEKGRESRGREKVRLVPRENWWYEAIFFIGTYLLNISKETVSSLYLQLLAP